MTPPKLPSKGRPKQPITQLSIVSRVAHNRTVTPQDVRESMHIWHQGGKEAFATLLENFHLAKPDTRKIRLQTISDLSPHDRVEALGAIHGKLTKGERYFYVDLFNRK